MTPLQARLTATLFALSTLGLVFWALAHTQFAYALDYDQLAASTDASDHNWHRIQEDVHAEHVISEAAREIQHTPRADTLLIDANDSPNHGDLNASQTDVWRYTQQLLQSSYANQTSPLPSDFRSTRRSIDSGHTELRKRAEDGEDVLEKRQTNTRMIYVSINTCTQPAWSSNSSQEVGPPQLSLYIGQSGAQNVGPGSSASQYTINLVEGFANFSLSASSDVYMAVSAPVLPSYFSGSWSYDIAVSINAYYHASNDDVPFLYLVDTDSTSALLVTENLTYANPNDTVYQQWLSLLQPLPFTMFANADIEPTFGLSRSYCGLKNIAQISTLRNATLSGPFINTSMISRGIDNRPKQQFFLGNMTSSNDYFASLALIGNGVSSGKGVVGGGGTVWQQTGWNTKSDGNCQLVYDMPFCTDVAYAVPSNMSNTTTALGAMYDNYAQSLYQNFSYSLQQIQCNTSNDQRYSLARDCDDCAKAYKQWLCAVTVPRCEDFSNSASFLQPRNVAQAFLNSSMLSNDILLTQYKPMPGAPTLPGSPILQTWNFSYATNQSRNPNLIDQQIAPGPYKEVLPCEDICYNLVQSCPAALGFSCPYPGRGLEVGYAPRPSSATIIQCNFPGAVYYIDDARHLIPSTTAVLVVAMLAMALAYI
ncbi:hypothetical protein AMS68_007316 [Peltaster fructicola]|uniref:FZ domain-containing protein n=1 Tax=Peltaster fructicola TaxID=286661 RepID=A0A6H0Y4M4_9PEZI|nr:hypothetical protein AMS68_007316 [Peltaster fructicola]